MNTALLVSYDGTDLCGWQVQARGRTVQGEMESAISAAFGICARVTGSGRTDAGVHAAGQVCNFALPDGIRISPERVADALNTFLPNDVRVLESAAVPETFDACRTAKKKTYRYSVYFSRRENPLLERYAVRFGDSPDFARMGECARLLEGEHDFAAFSSTGSSVKTTVRTVHSVEFVPWADELGERTFGVHIDVCGSGFLYNMVRIMAGAILECGTGKLSLSAVGEALRTGERDLLGKTMPAKGLTLLRVDYGFSVFGKKA
ncbi:MAG TPA: tRNA pseudouridine(38-40) synthase TruA [Candidatus Borkfalkia excrementigallinarum]|uniref:tRNA pseudouridine synthase A n=1 Tax=Candidatus Borkfalkia excrementigallinarum TaxID=2838506 RepID=A0A9D1ZV57_9FIRM|nr:tRNA pseudouridine(38-40) synthase TruA [Candidatus Borkfalkia excrementigallinarum]